MPFRLNQQAKVNNPNSYYQGRLGSVIDTMSVPTNSFTQLFFQTGERIWFNDKDLTLKEPDYFLSLRGDSEEIRAIKITKADYDSLLARFGGQPGVNT